MSLGERIYKLRTEKNLSQDMLAEMLEVSRQSVSKWENNNTVPDLEKLLKLSEIFEVSLDELVKGEKAQEMYKEAEIPRVEPPKVMPPKSIDFPLYRIAEIVGAIGKILVVIAVIRFLYPLFIGGGIVAILLWGGSYSLKFWIGGILCLLFEKKSDYIAEILQRMNINCK